MRNELIELIEVSYSYEHGDKSLPKLKDLVSDIEDTEKEKILKYLCTNCIYVCSGIIRDEIDPASTIGHGDGFSDGIYLWDDMFINYVKRYNIPVPSGFRNHILNNYENRMNKHKQLEEADSMEIINNPYLGYKYRVHIYKTGIVKYQNIENYKDGVVFRIDKKDAAYIIDPITTEFFCYDSENHGEPMIDGYHWEINYYKGDVLICKVEGRPGEDIWRYKKIKETIQLAERYVKKDLGYKYMN